MRISKPSPAMAVASVALFVSLGGTSVAAISYAKNAGAVDGKSAVSGGASKDRAAGKLVATLSKGKAKGQIPGGFVTGVPRVKAFGLAVKVTDDTPATPVPLASLKGIGGLTFSCNDSAAGPGVESSSIALTFTAAEQGVNYSSTTYRAPTRTDNEVFYLAPGAATTESIGRSGPFDIRINAGGKELRFDGVARDDGNGTPDAACLVYGSISRVDG